MGYQCVHVCDLWSYWEIRDQLTCHSHVCACSDLSETDTQPTKEQTVPDRLVYIRPCALSKALLYHCVCVCVSHVHTLPAFPSEARLPWRQCQTHGSSMITWQEKRGTLKEQRRETESTACSTLMIRGGITKPTHRKISRTGMPVIHKVPYYLLML